MIINSKFVKFKSCGINIPQTQNIDSNTDYEVKMTVSSNGGTFKNSDDGKTDIYYTLTPISDVEFIDTKKNMAFKGTKTGSSISKSMRGAIYYLHEEESSESDFNEFYEVIGKKIIKYLPEIYNLIKNKE